MFGIIVVVFNSKMFEYITFIQTLYFFLNKIWILIKKYKHAILKCTT